MAPMVKTTRKDNEDDDDSTSDAFLETQDHLPDLHSATLDFDHPDFEMLSSPPHVYTPPPHLAARLQRSANNRRRSSAASSRRNSLSSAHSQHSSRSYRGGHSLPQSNHVAQQLRRASIIENRKARLQDRAAHVEQVRLRAALVKATPRVSNSEERAQAALQARDRYLAKVAAACAEEVNRAKRVAEETKERKAADERRARLEMEERHAEAERRRLEFKRPPRRVRTTSIPAVEAKKPVAAVLPCLSESAAAKKIQRAWRVARMRAIGKSFLDLDLSIDRVKAASFDDASAMLASEMVNSRTADILVLLDLDAGARGDPAVVRQFLSAFMILGHPNDVFSQNGQQEQELMERAKELLISFEALLSNVTTLGHRLTQVTESEALIQAYTSYLAAFTAWKDRDARVIVTTMIDQFVVLDAIWQTVKDDTRGEVANDYRDGIRNHQVVLLSKIKKLAGAERANALIIRAIRESRMARRRRQGPIGDIRPRPVETPSVPAGAAPLESVTDNSNVSASEETLDRRDVELSEMSRIFSVIPPNRILTHELLIDPAYRIEVSSNSDIRSALNREVCESMRRGILQGQSEIWTVAVAENIRKRLLKLLKPGNSMHILLSEVLDPEHVRVQCRQGLFSYDKFFTFMADLLPKLCAPFRDSEVKAFAETLNSSSDELNIMMEKLFGLLHIIDLMSLDYTNYMISQAAPTLVREAAGYEQRMFTQDLQSGAVTVQQTKRWWRHASVNLTTDPGYNDPSGPSPSATAFSRIYARGLLDLAISNGPLNDSDIPETLQLDRNRLIRIRREVIRVTVTGAILLTAKNLLKRDVRSQWKPEAKRIGDALRDANPDTSTDLAARILATIESSRNMPHSTREQLTGFITRFLGECGLHLTPSNESTFTESTPTTNGSRSPTTTTFLDPVLKLLLARLHAHIFRRLVAATPTERVRVASTAVESLAGIGLGEFIGVVGTMADELEKVRSADLASHGEWLRSVAEEVERAGDDQSYVAVTGP